MKRAEIAYIANIRPKRLDLLKERGQTPFDLPEGGEFTLDHAFRLRLMLDLVGGEEDGFGGLAPSDAAPLVRALMPQFPVHPLTQTSPRDWWAGVAVLEKIQHDQRIRWVEPFAGEIEAFADWQAEKARFEARGPNPNIPLIGRHRVVRVHLVGVTWIARDVRERAAELGLDLEKELPR